MSQPVAGTAIILIFAAVIVLSVTFANLKNTNGAVAAVAAIVTLMAEPIFPWIDNYRQARASWGLPILQILKTESINSLWFIFGLLLLILGILRSVIAKKTLGEHKPPDLDEPGELHPKQHSGFMVFFAVSFVALLGISQFVGWGDFSVHRGIKKCLLYVQCYYKDDLMIIASAGMKCFFVFGFPAGAFLLVRDFFHQRRVKSKTDSGPG